MRSLNPLSSFILGFCYACILRAQNPVTHVYTVDDGLPSNEVYDILEDSLGYLWFATDHGVSRFDGYNFKNYSTGDGLSHNTVFGFFEDTRHRIWMRTINSSLCFLENDRIYAYPHNDSLRKFLGRNFIQNFAIDSVGDLWFISIREHYGLYHQDRNTGQIKKINIKTGFNAFIRELGAGIFIAGVDMSEPNASSVARTELVYEDHTWLFHTNSDFLHGRGLARAVRGEAGHYLFSFNSELTEFANGRILKRRSLNAEDPVECIYRDRQAKIWLTGRGLVNYNNPKETFYRKSLIYSLRQDRHGGFWLATADAGVFYIPDIRIREFELSDSGEKHLLAQVDDRLYTVLNKQTLLSLPLDSSGPDAGSSMLLRATRPFMAQNLFVDRKKKQVILGAMAFGIEENKHSGKLVYLRSFAKGIGFVRSTVVKRNLVYAAGSNGWGILDKHGNNMYSSQTECFLPFCTVICVDSTDKVWIGTADGLFSFETGHTLPFRPTDSLFRYSVSDVKCMPDGKLIVSTRGGGIIIIDKEHIYNLNTLNGLSTNLCDKITVEENLFWVCSFKGLNKVQIRRKPDQALTFHITCLKMENGLPSNLIHDALRYKDQIILATARGLAWFNVEAFLPNHYVPPVYFSEVRANQRRIKSGAHLAFDENNLSFSFTGLLYNSAGQVQYRYRLRHHEDTWNYTQDRSVRYFNLPPGQYEFEVAAMNENGLWNNRTAGFSFFIPQHFSKTWWFRGCIVAFLALILWLIIRYYLDQRRLQERTTSDLLMAELKTLRSQMKPHFIFNSLSSIQHFIIESDQESAHLYLSRFSSLMRKILENTQKNTITLAREIETLDLYLSLEELRFSGNFEYHITVAEDIVPASIEMPPMLLQPYVENAIWHGLLPKKQEARLSLRFFSEKQTTLVCEIEDNGVGRKLSAEKLHERGHRSMGIRNIEERIDILNRINKGSIDATIIDLQDEMGRALGTKVVLRLVNALNTMVET